jgi:glycine dehydrogenase subunit 1
MTAATIYLSIVGPEGLERIASASMARTAQLAAAACAVEGVRAAFNSPRFHEILLRLDTPVAPVLEALASRGIAGGYDASGDYPELAPALLVCATETKTDEDIAHYANALAAALGAARAA